MFNDRKHLLIQIVLVTALLFTLTGSATAASIKDRMAARIPAITALKDQGVIGENNTGYLEFRGQNRPDQATVSAENKDRKTVYAAIAKKQNVSPQLVGQRRAKQIADKGRSGHWFQDSSGKWYRK